MANYLWNLIPEIPKLNTKHTNYICFCIANKITMLRKLDVFSSWLNLVFSICWCLKRFFYYLMLFVFRIFLNSFYIYFDCCSFLYFFHSSFFPSLHRWIVMICLLSEHRNNSGFAEQRSRALNYNSNRNRGNFYHTHMCNWHFYLSWFSFVDHGI